MVIARIWMILNTLGDSYQINVSSGTILSTQTVPAPVSRAVLLLMKFLR